MKGLHGVSAHIGGVDQESSLRGRFVQPQVDAGAEVAPEGRKGWASEFDLDPAESGEPEGSVEQQSCSVKAGRRKLASAHKLGFTAHPETMAGRSRARGLPTLAGWASDSTRLFSVSCLFWSLSWTRGWRFLSGEKPVFQNAET